MSLFLFYEEWENKTQRSKVLSFPEIKQQRYNGLTEK